MAFSPSDYSDDTAFERLVLERLGVHRIRIDNPGAIVDVRGQPPGGPKTISVTVIATMGAGSRDELLQSLRPLAFGAAYKVLDLLVEHILRTNGAPIGKLTFVYKAKAVKQRPAVLPVPLDAHLNLWDRIAALYKAYDDARHAVTHRRAGATAQGDLEIFNNQRRRTDVIASNEVASFAAGIHAVAEAVIEAASDGRRLGILRWHLNALASRHGLPELASAMNPNAGRRLLEMDLAQLEGGRLRFDVLHAKEVVDSQQASFWDLRLHLGDERAVFVGRWEAVTDHNAPIDFDRSAPPDWLSEQVA
jgi:hypothetical protein